MKYILTENKLKDLLNSLLYNIRIRIVYDGKDMVYPNGKPIFNNSPQMWDRYLRHFNNPFIVIIHDGEYFVAQKQSGNEWLIQNDIQGLLNERQLIEILGLNKFGINLDSLIYLKMKNESQNIQENKNQNNLTKFVYKKGVFEASQMVGSYSNLLKRIAPNEIPIEMKAEAIVDYLDSNSDGYGLGFGEIGIDPILWKETVEEIHQIEYLGRSGVIVQVWGEPDYQTDVGEYGIPYDALPHEILDEILTTIIS